MHGHAHVSMGAWYLNILQMQKPLSQCEKNPPCMVGLCLGRIQIFIRSSWGKHSKPFTRFIQILFGSFIRLWIVFQAYFCYYTVYILIYMQLVIMQLYTCMCSMSIFAIFIRYCQDRRHSPLQKPPSDRLKFVLILIFFSFLCLDFPIFLLFLLPSLACSLKAIHQLYHYM